MASSAAVSTLLAIALKVVARREARVKEESQLTASSVVVTILPVIAQKAVAKVRARVEAVEVSAMTSGTRATAALATSVVSPMKFLESYRNNSRQSLYSDKKAVAAFKT